MKPTSGPGPRSTTSWNGILGVGYKFGWGDLLVAWRYLDYKLDTNQPVQKLIMSGPAFGARFTLVGIEGAAAHSHSRRKSWS